MFDLNRIPQLKAYLDESQRLLDSGYIEQSANTLRKSFEIVMHLLSLTHIKIYKGKHYDEVKYYETKLNAKTLYNNGVISEEDYDLLDFISRVTNQASHATGARKIIDFNSKRDIEKYKTDMKYYVEFVKRKLDAVPKYLINESCEFTVQNKQKQQSQQKKTQPQQNNKQQPQQNNKQQSKKQQQPTTQQQKNKQQLTTQQQNNKQQQPVQPNKQQQNNKQQPQKNQQQQSQQNNKQQSKSKPQQNNKQQPTQQNNNNQSSIQQQSQSTNDYDYDYDEEYTGSIRQSISNVFSNILDAIEPRVSNKKEVSNRPIEIIINGYKNYALCVIGKIYGTPEIDKNVLSTLKKYTKPNHDCYVSFKRFSASIYFKEFNKIVNKASPNSPVVCEITAVLYSESKIKLDLLRNKILTTKSIHCDIKQNAYYKVIDTICLTDVIPYIP